MSTMPPYTPGPQGPRLDRATLNAQRRAAKQQARYQRDQVRLQQRAARRSSIVGPLLLLALGVVLLLLETGRWRWSSALTWLSHWWPLVLILAGALSVAEYLWDRTHPLFSNGIPVRRSLGGGTGFLLVLLALLGIGISLAQGGSEWARQAIGDHIGAQDLAHLPTFLGIRAQYTDSLDAALASGGTLTINDPRGDITLNGSSQDGRVHVSVQQHVYAWRHEDAETQHAREAAHLSGDPHHLTLSASPSDPDTVDLTIQLPHDVALALHSQHGDITVEELRGDVDLTTGSGTVKLTALRGPVHLSTADDDAEVDAHSLTGGFTLQGRTGDINVSDLDGPLSLAGDFFGTTHLEHIRGTVHFKSSFTDFSCNNLPGDLNVDGRSDLDARQLEGPVTLVTTNRNITLDGVRGAATVSNRNGSVHLGLLSPLQPVTIHDADGSVELNVPPGSSFALQSSTHNGEIHNGLGLNATKAGETAQLNAHIGTGGPAIHLETTEGDITLNHANTTTADTGWTDADTKITPTPAHKAKSPSKPAKDAEGDSDDDDQ